ncbi:hypothetical protein [Mariniblastus fucicola]|uniref:Uncharacterized protein n=1 Tax=Mariniblastus fucicola TaxID=980251 RepID=A0A5B9PAI4_9BACT|nr:hypothetical protein [Mariniblastus fucicola]QEG22235.1 hypothetical protein MFFC18_21110 [Mariniblastus fucicola]
MINSALSIASLLLFTLCATISSAQDIPLKADEWVIVESPFGEIPDFSEYGRLFGVWQEYQAYSEGWSMPDGFADLDEELELKMPTFGDALFHLKTVDVKRGEMAVGFVNWDVKKSNFSFYTYTIKVRKLNKKLAFFISMPELDDRFLVALSEISENSDHIRLYFPNITNMKKSASLANSIDVSRSLITSSGANFLGDNADFAIRMFNDKPSFSIRRFRPTEIPKSVAKPVGADAKDGETKKEK